MIVVFFGLAPDGDFSVLISVLAATGDFSVLTLGVANEEDEDDEEDEDEEEEEEDEEDDDETVTGLTDGRTSGLKPLALGLLIACCARASDNKPYSRQNFSAIELPGFCCSSDS